MNEQWTSAGVELSVPAHEDFVSAIRVQARWIALRADLGIEDVDDLQMAIGESATLLLPLVDASDPRFYVSFELSPFGLRVTTRVRSAPEAIVDRDGLAWMLLSALVPDVDVDTRDGETSIEVSRSRVTNSS